MANNVAGPVRLGAPHRGDSVVGRAAIVVSGESIPVEICAPAGPTRLQDLLPILYDLSDLLADRAAAAERAAGREISCRKGCGACCRQLVPVSREEAFALADLVAAMPPPRQRRVRQKFADALAALSQAGVGDRLLDPSQDSAGALGLDYVAAAVACPFLVDEACSIHSQRPTACREYLVTSDPVHCVAPTRETVKTARLEARPSRALLKAGGAGWLPLVLALDFAARTPPAERTASAPELLREVLMQLAAPSPDASDAAV